LVVVFSMIWLVTVCALSVYLCHSMGRTRCGTPAPHGYWLKVYL
jgi:hypothetical protein